MRRFGITIIGILLSVVTVFAQDCPTMERAAAGEGRIWCVDTPANHACFGNSIVSAELTSFADDDMSFSSPSDIIALTDIASLETSFDENRYGVALIHTSSYAPDTWEAQDVTLALLGDVTVSNTAQEGITVPTITTEIAASEGANIRTGITTEFRILTPLFQSDTVKLTGRLDDSSWFRVQLPDGENGWVAASALEGDFDDLPVVDTDSPQPDLLYPPYTAFSLRTAGIDRRCAETWDSGLLLQTPTETPLRFVINEQPLIIQGTVYIQAAQTDTLELFVLEGSVAFGDTEVVEGYQATLSTQADSAGNILPPLIEPYDFARMAFVPTEVLPRYVYIGIDITTIITPAPNIDRSPIIDTLVTEPCVLTTGQTGANLRGGPGREFPMRGVLAYRETANPIGRATGSDGVVWWELEQNVWINSTVVVTGGDCAAVQRSDRIPNPPPTATPES